MNSSALLARFNRSWPLLVLLLITTVWLYRSPYSASNLEIPPDSIEYALASLELVETGRCELIVEGRGLPSRYPPWFSAFVLAPAYLLFGHEPGNAILPITFLAVMGIALAYVIGKRISSNLGGVFAALALLCLPSYSRWSIQIMTDVPCVTLMLGACLLYLRLQIKPESGLIYLGAGALIALTALFRPVYGAMLLPFVVAVVRPRKGAWLRAVLLLTPMAAAAAATWVYNRATFGSPFRNGYNFWIPVPMDYPAMVFSLSYLRENLSVISLLGFPVLVLLCGIAVFLARRFRPAAFAASQKVFRRVLLFFVLSTGPIMLFHLGYFFPDDRFYLPLAAGAAILAGSMVALLLGPGRETILKVLLPALLLLATGARLAVPSPIPLRRLTADWLRQQTPDNAVIISAIDPVYLARLAGRGSARRIVPISRNVEFAWTLLGRKRVDDPRVASFRWPDIGPALDLLRPHAEPAVKFVASERMDELAVEVARGTPVFIDSTFVSAKDASLMREFNRRFKLVERAPHLYRLESH